MDVITDAKDRKIGLRKLTVLDQARILRAVGPAQAMNQPYVQMVTCAFMAADLDGAPLPAPTNEAQIDATLAKLGDEGMAVLMGRMVADIQRIQEAAQVALEGQAADPLAQPAS